MSLRPARRSGAFGACGSGSRRLWRQVADQGIQPQETTDPVVEIVDVGGIEGILKAEHPHRMGNLAKALCCRGAHLRGRAGAGKRAFKTGKGRFQRGKPALHPVVVGIAERRRIVTVIRDVGVQDLRRQLCPFGHCLTFGHLVDRSVTLHPPLRTRHLMHRCRAGSGQVRRWRPDAAWISRRSPGRAAHSRGPRRFRCSSLRPSPRPVSCAACR